MAKAIQLGFDKEATWKKVKGRISVFLDTNCWIVMRDDRCPTAIRVKKKLQKLVSEGRAVCPLSWGLIEELFKQENESRQRTAKLMEELSLNVTFVMRQEAFDWELERSIRRLTGHAQNDKADLTHHGMAGLPDPGAAVDETPSGLFAPVGAFCGSQFSVVLPDDYPLEEVDHELVRSHAKRELGAMGLAELVMNVPTDEKHQPPAYSEAAKEATAITKDKRRLLVLEATNIFKMYVLPSLQRFPPALVANWAEKVGQGSHEGFPLNVLTTLPALHNYVEIMATVDSEPTKKDKDNDFFDYEIMAVPLAYSTAFVARDKGIRHLLRQRTGILKRTTCHYCDGLEALEQWLKAKGLW